MPQKVCEGDNLHVIFRIRWEKWGISGKTNIKEWSTNLKTGKAPKLNMIDFGAFHEKNAYAITCKLSPPQTFWGISRNLPYSSLEYLRYYIWCCNQDIVHLRIKSVATL